MSKPANEITVTESPRHLVSYPRFLWRAVVLATDGSFVFYTWMTLLTAIFLVGVWTDKLQSWMDLLREHEAGENKLVQESFNIEPGGGD